MNHKQAQNGEIYLEFQTLGQSQKVIAIDPLTHIEVTVTGPVQATREHMIQLAVRKLKRRIEQLK